MSVQPYKGVYEKMEREGKFPKVPYAEYPKLVTLKNGTRVTVANQAEELRMIEEVVPVVSVAKLEADKANVEKLLEEAQARMKELEEQLKAKVKEDVAQVENDLKATATAIVAPPKPPAKPSA